MADTRWTGAAQDIAQVTTVQITAYDAATTYTLTINSKDISVVGTTDADGTASALSTAWNASAIPEIAEITATVSTDTVTLTGDTAGKPFTVTSSVAGGTGTIGSPSTTTAATGKNFADNGDNWTEGSAPGAGDNVYIEDSDISILYGLTLSGTITSLNISSTFTGTIGLPKINADGTQYVEYRADYLSLDATTINIGWGDGQGSGRIKINNGSTQSTLNVYSTGSSLESNLEPVLWKGTHASNAAFVSGSSQVGVAVFGEEAATLTTLNVSGNSEVRTGQGTTVGTIEMNGTELRLGNGCTTLTCWNGDTIVQDGGVTTLTATSLTGTSSTVFYNSTGTLGTANLSEQSVLDFSLDPRTKTVTNPIEIYGGGPRILDPEAVVSSLIVDFNNGAVSDQVVWGNNIRLQRSATA